MANQWQAYKLWYGRPISLKHINYRKSERDTNKRLRVLSFAHTEIVYLDLKSDSLIDTFHFNNFITAGYRLIWLIFTDGNTYFDLFVPIHTQKDRRIFGNMKSTNNQWKFRRTHFRKFKYSTFKVFGFRSNSIRNNTCIMWKNMIQEFYTMTVTNIIPCRNKYCVYLLDNFYTVICL